MSPSQDLHKVDLHLSDIRKGGGPYTLKSLHSYTDVLMQAREAMLRDVMAIASKPPAQPGAPAPKKAKVVATVKATSGTSSTSVEIKEAMPCVTSGNPPFMPYPSAAMPQGVKTL